MYEGNKQDTSKIDSAKNISVVTQIMNKVLRDKNGLIDDNEQVHLSQEDCLQIVLPEKHELMA